MDTNLLNTTNWVPLNSGNPSFKWWICSQCKSYDSFREHRCQLRCSIAYSSSLILNEVRNYTACYGHSSMTVNIHVKESLWKWNFHNYLNNPQKGSKNCLSKITGHKYIGFIVHNQYITAEWKTQKECS